MNFKDLFSSKCERDYHSRHFWQSLGVVGLRPTYRVWHCTQCDKCIHEEIKLLVKVVPSSKTRKENKGVDK